MPYTNRPLQVYGGNVVLDAKTVLLRAVKYMLQCGVVAATAYFVPHRRLPLQEVLVVALVAATTFSLLDLLLPELHAPGRVVCAKFIA